MTTAEFAPAKVNLYLHVGPLGADGYHPLESWMAFADIGDVVSMEPADAAAFEVRGPFAAGVPTDASNLAVKARDRLLGDLPAPFRLTLEKYLPPASGIGGGSSDAAAVLRLLKGLASGVNLAALALELGADVPACLRAASLIARGRGEALGPAPLIPPLPTVLVNPGVGVSTKAIFGLYDHDPPEQLRAARLAPSYDTPDQIAADLRATGNDLQAPALALAPVIGEVLRVLEAEPETLLARMSGSGATCFALCRDSDSAASLAAKVARHDAGWWVEACTLS